VDTSVSLSYVTLVCQDIDRISDFYAGLFALAHVPEVEGEIFRAVRVGDTILGFNPAAAFELLNLPESALDATAPMFLTFEVGGDDEVDRLTAAAIIAGGTLLKAPYRTYYGAWQAVLLDPEMNAFRINRSASSTL
jgi:catechol 2,3-dioxygenase-like lactoylglutathione lyase family enzyme